MRAAWVAAVLAGVQAVAGCDSDAVRPRPQTDRTREGGASIQPYREHLLVTARPRAAADVEVIWRQAEFVLAPHDPAFTTHLLVVKHDTLERLRSSGLPVTVESADAQAVIDRAAQAPTPREALLPNAGRLGIFGAFFDRVQQLDALMAYLDELVVVSGGRAQVVTLGRSVEDRPLKALRISSLPEGTAGASAIVTGTQHAREWASPMVTIGLADALVRQYAGDPQVKRIVDTLEIFIIPVTNPDGYVASHNGRRLQRKNMNPRCNVDLNRNWGEWWGMGVPRDGCNEETYPGQGAFSEPETQAVRQLAESRKNLRFYMDYHAAANQIMYPPCFVRATSAQDEVKGWSEAYAAAFAGVNGADVPARSCFGIGGGQGGCSTDWFFNRVGTTLEMELRPGGSLGGFGLTNEQVLPFVEENWSAWAAVLAKVADKYGASGAAADGGTEAARPGSDAAAPDGEASRDVRAEAPGDGPPRAVDGATPADTGADTPDQREAVDAGGGTGPAAAQPAGGCSVAARPPAGPALAAMLVLLLGVRYLRPRRRR